MYQMFQKKFVLLWQNITKNVNHEEDSWIRFGDK